mmetsp:Transcript_3242/g.6100  ORF Transcript_3242/g.6100 Transcript_3242/m.6100 type:complete len:273 (+) Transcript_3242:782-1600(+)
MHDVVNEKHFQIQRKTRGDNEACQIEWNNVGPFLKSVSLFSSLLVVHIQDICDDTPLFIGFQNERRAGKERLREAHVPPITEVVIEHFQMMRLNIEVRLGCHGMTKLRDGISHMKPTKSWDPIASRSQDGHETKVHVNQFGDSWMDDFGCNGLTIFETGLVDLCYGTRSQRFSIKRLENFQETTLWYIQARFHLFLRVIPRMSRSRVVQFAQGIAESHGEHVRTSARPLAVLDKGRPTRGQTVGNPLVPDSTTKLGGNHGQPRGCDDRCKDD